MSANEMKIADVLVACDSVECGYRIVELTDGRYAFVWGNIRAHIGDVLPPEQAESPTAERGIELFDSYLDAKQSYCRCANALHQTSSQAGREMLAVLEEWI